MPDMGKRYTVSRDVQKHRKRKYKRRSGVHFMTDDIGSLFARWALLFALMLGTLIPGVSSAAAQPAERNRQDRPTPNTTESASRPRGQPLTEFEKMQLHHRRYSAAANNMAHLFKLLNQKIQEVSLAAKTVEAKDNSHNRRQLEIRLQQLENARVAYSVQYLQLQSQMQNEYRNYAAISNDLKAKYDGPARSRGETGRDTGSAMKAKPDVSKSAKAKSMEDKDTGSDTKAKESPIEEQFATDSPARDPRILDLDTKEVRARREGRSEAGSSGSSLPAPGQP